MEKILKSTFESLDVPYEKFRILFINIFTILYKAATLNPRKLGSDIQIIHKLLSRSSRNPIIAQLYILFVSLVLFTKFFFGYVGLSANVIAILPILSDEGPELLTPSIIAQTVENVLFSMLDIAIGCVTVRYFLPCQYPIFFIFLTKQFVQISIGISILNIYRDFYQSLKYNFVYTDSNTLMKGSDERELFLRKESLI